MSSTPELEFRKMHGSLLKTLGVASALTAIMALAHYVPIAAQLIQMMATWHDSRAAAIYFVLIGIPYAALGMPRQALCAIAGLIFGVLTGLSLALATTIGGNLIDFYVARLIRRRRIRYPTSAPSRSAWQAGFAALGNAATRAPFRTILILRLMPVGSALLVALGAGYYGIPVAAFIAATLLGSLPQNLVFVLIGSGTHIGHGVQILLGALLFLLSLALGFFLMRKERQAAHLVKSGDAEA